MVAVITRRGEGGGGRKGRPRPVYIPFLDLSSILQFGTVWTNACGSCITVNYVYDIDYDPVNLNKMNNMGTASYVFADIVRCWVI